MQTEISGVVFIIPLNCLIHIHAIQDGFRLNLIRIFSLSNLFCPSLFLNYHYQALNEPIVFLWNA